MQKTSLGLDQNIAGLLCYLIPIVFPFIALFTEKDNRFVRFHAMQSLGLTLLITAVQVLCWLLGLIIGWIPFINFLPWLLRNIAVIVYLAASILMCVKSYQNEFFKLPIIGDVCEQRL